MRERERERKRERERERERETERERERCIRGAQEKLEGQDILYAVLVRVTIAMMTLHDQSNLRRKGFTWLLFHITAHH